ALAHRQRALAHPRHARRRGGQRRRGATETCAARLVRHHPHRREHTGHERPEARPARRRRRGAKGGADRHHHDRVRRSRPRARAGARRRRVHRQADPVVAGDRHRLAAPRDRRLGRDAMTLDEALDRWLDHLKVERNVSPHTLASYSRDLTQLFRALPAGTSSPGQVTGAHITGFLLARPRAGVTARSRARALSAVRGFFRFLNAEREIDGDPTELLPSPKLARKLPEVLPLGDVDRLLAAPDTNTPRGLRDAAMIATLYATGLRVSELVKLRVEDADLGVGCLRATGKGRKQRLVPVGD